MTKHYLAEMETEHYSWKAIGTTPEQAKRAILKAWNSDDWREKMTLQGLDDWYGISIYELKDGECIYE